MKKNGFTLVEILTVVAIIGILALLILPNFISSFNNTSNKAMISQENQVVDAARLFLEDYCRNPLLENKGKCSVYSLYTNESNIKYTCLTSLQNNKYIDEITFKGQYCSGFVIYENNFKGYKSYLKCGDSYETQNVSTFKDQNGRKIIDLCLGTVGSIPVSTSKTSTISTTTTTRVAIVENYINLATNVKYASLYDAFRAVSNNQIIQVLQNVTETSTATLDSSKSGVKLDLNGKKIIMNNVRLYNQGILDVYNSSNGEGIIAGGYDATIFNLGVLTLNGTSTARTLKIEKTAGNSNGGAIVNNASGRLEVNNNVEITDSAGTSHGISNHGVSIIKSGTISGNYSIYNNGTMTISGGTLIGTRFDGFENSGQADISGGTFTGREGINNLSSGEVTISGNPYISGTDTGISNHGKITLKGGIISGNTYGLSNYTNATINNGKITGNRAISNSGTITINGGTITGSNFGLDNSGNAIINNGDITSTSNYGINSYGNVTIYGGNITGSSYAINNTSNLGSTFGTLTMLGGTASGKSGGISSVAGYTTLTLGKKDGVARTDAPVIIATGTSGKYGITLHTSTNFNFYDGIIKSYSGSGFSISGNVTDMETNFHVLRDVRNGIETATLDRNQ